MPDKHQLWDESPSFLGRLGEDPVVTQRELAIYAYKLFTIRPRRLLPHWYRMQNKSDLLDFVLRLVTYLCENDFRTLKQYRLIPGRPLAAWLSNVANRLIEQDIKDSMTSFSNVCGASMPTNAFS